MKFSQALAESVEGTTSSKATSKFIASKKKKWEKTKAKTSSGFTADETGFTGKDADVSTLASKSKNKTFSLTRA